MKKRVAIKVLGRKVDSARWPTVLRAMRRLPPEHWPTGKIAGRAGEYVLDASHCPVICKNLILWARWFGRWPLRRIRDTQLGPVRVATIFLGLDHSYGHGPPIFYEMTTFGPRGEINCERYRTRKLAILGHERAVARVAAMVTVQ